jgi:hypothetical protein
MALPNMFEIKTNLKINGVNLSALTDDEILNLAKGVDPDLIFRTAVYGDRYSLIKKLLDNGIKPNNAIEFISSISTDREIRNIVVNYNWPLETLKLLFGQSIVKNEYENVKKLINKLPQLLIQETVNNIIRYYDPSEKKVFELLLESSGINANDVIFLVTDNRPNPVDILEIIQNKVDKRKLESHYEYLLPRAAETGNYPLVEFLLNQKIVKFSNNILNLTASNALEYEHFDILQRMFKENFDPLMVEGEDIYGNKGMYQRKGNKKFAMLLSLLDKKVLTGSILEKNLKLAKTLLRVYDPFDTKTSKLLQSVNFGDRYPNFSLKNAFKDAPLGIMFNPNLAIEYLENKVSEEFSPGSLEARKTIDDLNYQTGKLTKEQYESSYQYILVDIDIAFISASIDELCYIIHLFSNMFELDGACNMYQKEELIDAIKQLLPELNKLQLFTILKLIK